MISSFRKLSKSWVAPIIVGLIALSWALIFSTLVRVPDTPAERRQSPAATQPGPASRADA